MITLRTPTLELIRRWDDEPHVIDSCAVYRITRAEWLAANDRG